MSKKKLGGTVRMNISIPTRLKRRMDKVKVDVNWSATACRAFEDAIAEIETAKNLESAGHVLGIGECRLYVQA